MAELKPLGHVMTLNIGGSTVSRTPSQIVTTVLNFIFSNPGGVSELLPDEEVSLNQLVADFGNTPDELCRQLTVRLDKVLIRYFGDGVAKSSIDYEIVEDDDGDTMYKMIISVYRIPEQTPIVDRYETQVYPETFQ